MHFERLDGLRFLAIFFVLIHHFASFFSLYIDWGYYGVDLFFVISGFLITGILIKQNSNNFKSVYKNFLIRRCLRIFPLYYLTIILLYLIKAPDIKKYLFYLISYTFNYKFPFLNDEGQSFGHFWSLAVEEQFYLFWPFIILLIRNKKQIIIVTLTLIIFAFLQINFNIIKELKYYNYTGLPSRMGSLGIGALGAIIQKHIFKYKILFTNKFSDLIVFALLILSLIKHFPFLMAVSSLLLVLKSTIFEFNSGFINKFLSNKHIRYIGTISYGIYIYHLPIGYYLLPKIFDSIWVKIPFNNFGLFSILQWHSWILKFPLYSAITIIIASISYKYFEKPILNFKDQFFNYSNK